MRAGFEFAIIQIVLLGSAWVSNIVACIFLKTKTKAHPILYLLNF